MYTACVYTFALSSSSFTRASAAISIEWWYIIMGFLRIDTHRYAHARTGQGQQPPAPSFYQLVIDYVYTNSIHPIPDSIWFKGIVTRGQHSTASIGPATGNYFAYCLLPTHVRHPLLYRCSTFRSLLLLLSSRDRDGRDRKKKGRTTTIISESLNIFYKKTTAAAASRRCIISCWYTVLQRYQPSSRAYYCHGVRIHSVLSSPAAVAVTNSLSSYFIAVQFKFL